MFLTPVFSTQMVLEPTFGPPKRDPASPTAPSIVSSASSDASFGFSDRRDSTSSNVSVSTDASSVPSVKPSPKPKHRKTLSSNSITRRLLQKRRPEQPQRKSEPPPTSSPVINSTPLAPLTPPPPPAPVALPPSPPVSEEKSSDLVVRCRSDVYHVDRVIMCYHSRWFARVCAVVMSPKSSAKGAIDLSADDPSAVAAMMQYCYQLDYVYRVSDFDNEGAEDDTLSAHVKVYMLAERYGVAGLRAVALQKFKQAAALVLNEDGKEEQLLLAIRVMYATDRRANADDLRRVAVKLCADHVQDFIHDTGKKMALVYESMEEYPDFRAELFEEMGSRWRQ